MWKVRVEAVNRTTGEVEKKEFVALDTYALTPEQKLLWQMLVGEDKEDWRRVPEKRTEELKITNMRIKTITEMRLTDGS
jgi:hypothetical protein